MHNVRDLQLTQKTNIDCAHMQGNIINIYKTQTEYIMTLCLAQTQLPTNLSLEIQHNVNKKTVSELQTSTATLSVSQGNILLLNNNFTKV